MLANYLSVNRSKSPMRLPREKCLVEFLGAVGCSRMLIPGQDPRFLFH